jgi:NADPH:quinone reductase-like Zn-dependent oxidoreductase
VQLAKLRGARVIALTSKAKASRLTAVGADSCIDREGDDVAGAVERALGGSRALDVVADLVAGDGLPSLLGLLRPGGRCAIAGTMGGRTSEIDLRDVIYRDVTIRGTAASSPEAFAAVLSYVESGRLKPLLAAVYPLANAAEAQERLIAYEHVGKVVLSADAQPS